MKLQVQQAGAWRDVLKAFKAKDLSEVCDAAQFLAKAGGVRGMQIVDDGIEVCLVNARRVKSGLLHISRPMIMRCLMIH